MEVVLILRCDGYFKPVSGHINIYVPLEKRIQPCAQYEATIYWMVAECGCNTHAEAGERIGRSFGLVNVRGLSRCSRHLDHYYRHVHSTKDENGLDTIAFKMKTTAFNDREV